MDILNRGSTAIIKRFKSNTVVKCIDRPPGPIDIDHFSVEKQILDILGPNPRITDYLGISQQPVGLLFTEANCGDLQQYLDTHNDTISEDLRLTWCFQAAEAITYIHSKAIIHSDLRPENLLHHTREDESTPELLLCDFGGSYCKIGDKVIDGGHLPDTGFFNPNSKWVSDRDTDIFALGSVFYTVMTGHWPYKSPGPFVDVEEWDEYDEKVNELFMNREFPPVGNLVGGDITLDCWTEKIRDAWGGCSSLRGFAATGEVGEGRKEEEVAELAPNPIDLRQKTYHISSLLSVMAKLELRSTVSVAERSLLVMLAIVWLS